MYFTIFSALRNPKMQPQEALGGVLETASKRRFAGYAKVAIPLQSELIQFVINLKFGGFRILASSSSGMLVCEVFDHVGYIKVAILLQSELNP